jgi:hypothetical protein
VLILTGAARAAAIVAIIGVTNACPALGPVAAAAGRGNGCYTIYNTWICVYSGGSVGGTGSGGGVTTYTCTYAPASEVILQRIGAGKPDPGYQWDIMTCPGPHIGPGALVEVSTRTGMPRITPAQLLKIAIGELTVPTLPPVTAPPRGKDGLVGLPEWFWVPSALWRPESVTVRAGPIWATATATPTTLTYAPGGALGPVSCAGPGTPLRSGVPAAAQHTACSYTYTQPSAGQPGNAYQAALDVTWTISWTGSGGAGGMITTGYTTGATFGVRVAQAEALVTTP